MSEHTPKWFAGSDLGYGELNGTEIFDERYYVVAVTIGDVPSLDSKANAALIVRAVNSHAALRAALSKIADEAEEFSHGDQNAQSIVRGLAAIARRALTEA